MDVLREAFEREPWVDEDGVVPMGHVTLEDGDAVDIGQMVQAVRQF